MTKVLAISGRMIVSILLVLAAALYLGMGCCTISLEEFAAGVTPGAVAAYFTSLNWVSITVAALVLCALLRLLDIAWNMAFCLSFVPVLFNGMWYFGGQEIALPFPLHGNACMEELCTLYPAYPVVAAMVAVVFVMGWFLSTAPFRIAFTTLLSFGLWYGFTSLLHWLTLSFWAPMPEPVMPEMLDMCLIHPWVLAAMPAAFFLVYAVMVAFFETFISTTKKKPAPAETEEAPVEEKPEEAKPEAEEKAEPKAAAADVARPVLKPVAKPAPKVEQKPAPKAEEKPAAPSPEAKSEEKKEEKPEVESAPKTEPKVEEKSAETSTEPKPEEKA